MQLGPVLGFRGVHDEGSGPHWCVGVLLVVREADEDPEVTADAGQVSDAHVLLRSRGRRVLRVDLSVPQLEHAQRVEYRVDGAPYHFHVPAAGHPPRMAFASCNGFSDPRAMKRIDRQNERWEHLAAVHEHEPYALLLLGGDQVYADQIWAETPFKRWAERDRDDRVGLAFTQEMRRVAERFYLESLYLDRWAQPEVARVLARVPMLAMWDDHDIFDGWGSHTDAENDCAVFRGLFEFARTHFEVFQRQAEPGAASAGRLPGQPGQTWGHVVGPVALLGLDLRSERTNSRVMSQATWSAIVAWLDALPDAVDHLLVLTSIPVVYPDFTAIEQALRLVPGRHQLEDDLRDHWHSPPHKGERARLIQRLLGVSARGIRVTLVSGDVHVAAVGVIESTRDDAAPGHARVVNQLTSSGIVHPPPPAIAVWAFEHLVERTDEPVRGVTTRLMDLPGSGRKLLAARNWLSIEPDRVAPDGTSRRRLWCHWHLEGDTATYTKVVHPVG